jgi:hypothetical protein
VGPSAEPDSDGLKRYIATFAGIIYLRQNTGYLASEIVLPLVNIKRSLRTVSYMYPNEDTVDQYK